MADVRTEEGLQELQGAISRLASCHPLPWLAVENRSEDEVWIEGVEDAAEERVIRTDSGTYPPRLTAAFALVDVVNALPGLLAEVRRLREEAERARASEAGLCNALEEKHAAWKMALFTRDEAIEAGRAEMARAARAEAERDAAQAEATKLRQRLEAAEQPGVRDGSWWVCAGCGGTNPDRHPPPECLRTLACHNCGALRGTFAPRLELCAHCGESGAAVPGVNGPFCPTCYAVPGQARAALSSSPPSGRSLTPEEGDAYLTALYTQCEPVPGPGWVSPEVREQVAEAIRDVMDGVCCLSADAVVDAALAALEGRAPAQALRPGEPAR